MSKRVASIIDFSGQNDPATDLSPGSETAKAGSQLVTGRIKAISEDGTIIVALTGKLEISKSARTLVDITARDEGREVLMACVDGQESSLVILGIIKEQRPEEECNLSLHREEVEEMVVDGRRICFEASAEIVLRCGPGSITLRNDGKIVIKGTEILSRSQGTNRIKGASISIN